MTTVGNNHQQLKSKKGKGGEIQQSATIQISNIFTQVISDIHIHIHTSMSKHFLKSPNHFQMKIQNHHDCYQYIYSIQHLLQAEVQKTVG